MPLLLAEVMDKAPAWFALAIALLALTVPGGLILGRFAPRPAVAIALVVDVVLAALLVSLDRDDAILDYARAEAGTRGVALYSQHHAVWTGPLVGLLVGLSLRFGAALRSTRSARRPGG